MSVSDCFDCHKVVNKINKNVIKKLSTQVTRRHNVKQKGDFIFYFYVTSAEHASMQLSVDCGGFAHHVSLFEKKFLDF